MYSKQLSLLNGMDNSKNYIPQCLFFSRIIHLQRPYMMLKDYVLQIILVQANETHTHTHTHTHTQTKHSEKDNTGKG